MLADVVAIIGEYTVLSFILSLSSHFLSHSHSIFVSLFGNKPLKIKFVCSFVVSNLCKKKKKKKSLACSAAHLWDTLPSHFKLISYILSFQTFFALLV